MTAPATIPPHRLARLVRAGYLRQDRDSLRRLREWYEANKDEARRYATRDAHLYALLVNFDAELSQ
jgi:hypothetical protein